MTGTLVLDLDESEAVLVLPDRTEARRLTPALHLGGLVTPGCGIAVLLPDAGDELRLQEVVHPAVAPYGTAVYSSRLAALAAAAGAQGLSGPVLVCDLTPNGLYAGVAEVAEGRVQVDHRIHEPGLGWAAFTEAVARALPGPDGPSVARALSQGGERLAVTLDLARNDTAYADTPAVWVEDHPVGAGLLLECFAPYARRVRAALDEARAMAAQRALAGEFAVFSALGGPLFDKSLPLGPHAAAQGAVHLASGRFAEPAPAPIPLTLPLHRIKDGLLEELSVPIPCGPGRFASLQGGPLRLGTGPDDVPWAERAGLVLETAAGERRLDLAALPPGSYQVGARVSRRHGTVLAFRAGGESVPVFVPLESRT